MHIECLQEEQGSVGTVASAAQMLKEPLMLGGRPWSLCGEAAGSNYFFFFFFSFLPNRAGLRRRSESGRRASSSSPWRD